MWRDRARVSREVLAEELPLQTMPNFGVVLDGELGALHSSTLCLLVIRMHSCDMLYGNQTCTLHIESMQIEQHAPTRPVSSACHRPKG